MNIVIVESPAKAKTIEKYLGKDYKVLASYGHVRDLPSKNGSVDPDADFQMHYTVNPDSEKRLKEIAKAVKDADAVYLATDLDREGEAISWHVYEELKNRVKDMDKKQVHRIEFAEITKKAIQNAIAHPRDLATDLIDAQQARRALDYLVGFNLSPVLWRKVRGGLSAGRVQSVALRLICERENEIEAFNPEEYWTIEGEFSDGTNTLKAKLATFNGTKVEKFSFRDEASSTTAVNTLQPLTYNLSEIEKKQTRRNAAPPFITSTLQQDASRKLGFAARRTMQAAQRLYEAGHITYMRTDSVNLANEAIQSLRSEIQNRYGNDYVPEKPNYYKSKSQNAQEAHEAIRPTNPSFGPDEAHSLDSDQAKLYTLIWQRAMACQMAPAKVDQTAMNITAEGGKQVFRATGSVIAFPGFLKVYQQRRADRDDETILPDIPQNTPLDLTELLPEQHFTEPPPRYSEATLVKALEENGIGRPSTYAAIISTIQDRGYVRQEQRRLHPEDVGRIVNKFLTEHFPRYVDLGFTAEMEEKLDEISRGEKPWKPVLHEFWSPFKELVDDKITSVKKSDVTSEKTGETCPTCKEGELVIRLGKYGRFKGCSRYPECKHIEPLNKPEGDGEAKPEPKDTGITCTKCNKGTMLERKSRRGKTFYSCSTYPKCDFAVWDKPVDEPCPECGHAFTMVRELKKGPVKKCPNCDWQDPPMTEGEKKRAEAARARFAARKKGGTKAKGGTKKKKAS